jgi:hypothetical protein
MRPRQRRKAGAIIYVASAVSATVKAGSRLVLVHQPGPFSFTPWDKIEYRWARALCLWMTRIQLEEQYHAGLASRDDLL